MAYLNLLPAREWEKKQNGSHNCVINYELLASVHDHKHTFHKDRNTLKGLGPLLYKLHQCLEFIQADGKSQ